MPKPIFHIDADDLFRLKKEIKYFAGFEMQSKNDCAYLSVIIRNKTSEYLSESTLYRFFFKENNHQCYKNTLDKLSRYCGHKNWDEFCSVVKEDFNPFYTGWHNTTTGNVSLLRSCMIKQEFKSMEHFFENLPKNLDENKRIRIGLDLFEGLKESNHSNQKFYSIFSKSNFVRRLLFEEMADPDFRIKDADALYKWYLKNPQNNNQVELLQDFIFANAMLFRYHHKNGDIREMISIGEKLYRNNDFNLKQLSQINVFPQARWYAYRLWYSQITNAADYDVYEFELLELCKKAAAKFDKQAKNIVLYNTLDVLLNLGKNKLIHEVLLPLFKHDLKNKTEQKETVLSIMKQIEPNGIKRLIA